MKSPFKSNKVRVTSPFGERVMNGAKQFHAGIDVVGIDSVQVCAVVAGKVVVSQIITDKSNPTWEWGNYICILGNDNRYYYYCHLASRNAVVGQYVVEGQILGIMGNTGYSFGAHLHLEIRENDGTTLVNPADMLGIKNEVGVYEERKLESDLNILVKHGVINTPEYWITNAPKMKYLPELIGNMARYLENEDNS